MYTYYSLREQYKKRSTSFAEIHLNNVSSRYSVVSDRCASIRRYMYYSTELSVCQAQIWKFSEKLSGRINQRLVCRMRCHVTCNMHQKFFFYIFFYRGELKKACIYGKSWTSKLNFSTFGFSDFRKIMVNHDDIYNKKHIVISHIMHSVIMNISNFLFYIFI